MGTGSVLDTTVIVLLVLIGREEDWAGTWFTSSVTGVDITADEIAGEGVLSEQMWSRKHLFCLVL